MSFAENLKKTLLVSLALATMLMQGCAVNRASLAPVGEYALGDDAPEGLSGIVWMGGDSYAMVEDSGGRIHYATIGVDRASGMVTNCLFTRVESVPGLVDAEGIAFDHESGALYASDESGPNVFRIAEGGCAERIALPDFFRRSRPNKSLESLSLERTGGGIVLWTACEDALEGDGPASSATNAALVRIAALRPGADGVEEARWWTYRIDEARGRMVPSMGRNVPFNGVADIAALGDGRLMVMERNCGLVARQDDDGPHTLINLRIYVADVTGVPPCSSTPLRKELLFERDFPASNYEGIALGPELDDGSRLVVLVSDGDVSTAKIMGMEFSFQWKKALFTLKLSKDDTQK